MTEQMKEHLLKVGKGCDEYEILPKPSEMLMMGVEHFIRKLWHDASEEPEYGKNIVMIREQEQPFAGKYFGSRIKVDYKTYWDVYNGSVCQEIKPSKWCYLEDIVTLQDVKTQR